jgi:propanol-preferring alcohol dehydrogenase
LAWRRPICGRSAPCKCRHVAPTKRRRARQRPSILRSYLHMKGQSEMKPRTSRPAAGGRTLEPEALDVWAPDQDELRVAPASGPVPRPHKDRTMSAAVLHTFGSPLVVEQRPVPTAGDGEVVVRVEACGLCHTDIHAVRGDWPVRPSLPLVPGHEAVGKVFEAGDGVTDVHIGDRVAVPWLGWACGHCEYCLSGSEALCRRRRNTGYDTDGGFADYVKADADFVVKVPRNVDPLDAACLTCAGLSAYKAVVASGAGPADLTAIFGVGGLGHLAVQYARIVGATVIAVDNYDAKLAMASDLGANHTFNATETDPVAGILALGGANQAILAAGSQEAANQALASLRPGGTLVLLAIPANNTLHLPISETVHNGITVRGSIGGSRVDLARTFALQADGHTRVIHQARALSQVNDAIAEVEADEVSARLVFEFR